jgi:hypothetical protein
LQWAAATHCSTAAKAAKAGRSCVADQTYLADVLVRIVSGQTTSHQLHKLLAWGWKAARERTARVAA